jgi:rare lipoprotein A
VGKYWYHPLPHAKDYKESGIASWYGKSFHGKKTSNGEIYNMYAMTAAHKTLPLGVFVRVTNLNSGKSIEVRINDRGPFVRGRIIDLSYTAAKKLEIVGPGTAPVEVIALGAPLAPGKATDQQKYVKVDFFNGEFTFQVGAFSDRNNAQRLINQLKKKYTNAHMVTYDTGAQIFYRVRVGKCSNLEDAERFEQKLINSGYREAFIVAE